jgi:lipopolysaccharide/colanic/teichoic acid biosynthesis glycosyltransferase
MEGVAMPAPEPSATACAAQWLKTACDRSLAAVLLVPAAPVIALTAVAVRLTSVGPAFYRQTRVGRAGRPFTLFKIRTMTVDSEKDGPRWSTPGDSRVTPVGRLLRRTHLDELPQLWNVLKGDMSLVGPRPERPEFVPSLAAVIPRYQERLSVRPGVTGLAQVQLPADTDLDSVRRKLAYDLYYIEQGGLWLDFRLLLATGFKVLGMSRAGLVWLFRLPTGDAVESLYGGIATPEPRLPPDSVVIPAAEPALPMLATADSAR